MIEKIPDTKNGYKFGEGASQKEFQEICKSYNGIRCIITNGETYRRFATPIWGRNIITVNNRVNPDEFYINAVC